MVKAATYKSATWPSVAAPEDPRKKVAIRIETFRQNFPVDSPDFPGAVTKCQEIL